MRLSLIDKPGALARVATAFGEAGVSIDRMRQYGHQTEVAPVLIVTHKTTREALDTAFGAKGVADVLDDAPVALRIEEF